MKPLVIEKIWGFNMFNTLDFSTPPMKNASLIDIPQDLIVFITLLWDGALRAVTMEMFIIDLYELSSLTLSFSSFCISDTRCGNFLRGPGLCGLLTYSSSWLWKSASSPEFL